METGKELLTLRGHIDSVNSVAWSPDGKTIATASQDNSAKVRDAATAKELLTIKSHNSPLYSVSWSPDAKWLATANWDETAKVWNAESGQEELTLKVHHGPVNSAAWSPMRRGNDERLATGSSDGTISVWNATIGQELLTLNSHEVGIESMAWSPDSSRLAVAGLNGTVQIYALEIHELLKLARSRITRDPRDLTPEECLRYLQSRTCPPPP